MNTETEQIELLEKISQANEAQVDSMWAILKYKEMPSGKKRKRHKMATHKRKKRLRKNRHKKKK